MPSTIAIIGAGPAGSSAAFHLARAGADVTLIEARAFPRVKVCGEFVSPSATHLLEAILPPQTLREAGARMVDRFVLQLGDRERTLSMPAPAWSLSRRTLDDLLLNAARDAGARVLQPAPVIGVDHGPADDPEGRATLALADGSSLCADRVLHADGHGRFCSAPPTPAVPGLIGHKCHFVPERPIVGVTIRACRGAYVGTIQVEAHDDAHASHATIALVARRSLLSAHAGDIDATVRSLWPAWDAGLRTTGWLSCGVARSGFQPSGHPRAFRLGNACGAVDPVGGEGIGLALWSGTTLAGLLLASDGGTNLARVQRRYEALYRRRLRVRRVSCQLAAHCLMRPGLVGTLWPLLGVQGLTLAPWYAATGKPWLGRRQGVTQP